MTNAYYIVHGERYGDFRPVDLSGRCPAWGVTPAARQLNRVQSNITVRIQKLEDGLGVPLFTREGKRLRLTSAGRILLDYSEKILALAEQARSAVHETRPYGLLRLGTMESTAAARLPRPLCEYHARFPEVAIELRTGSPGEQIALLLSGELDAALIAEPLHDSRLNTLVIFEEELVIVAGTRHPPIATPRDVRPRTTLVFHPGCPYRARLEGWFARAGTPIERMIELTSYHAMLGCAAAGMGVAMMPLSVIRTFSEQSRLGIHPISDPDFNSARTLFVWHRATQRPAIERFAEILLAHSVATEA